MINKASVERGLFRITYYNMYETFEESENVGGSLIDHGGQNLLEPAAQGLAILSGPSLRNFSDISKQLISNNALDIINDSLELSERFLFLIENKEIASKRGQSAYKVFSDNRGSLDRIFNKLKPSIDNFI